MKEKQKLKINIEKDIEENDIFQKWWYDENIDAWEIISLEEYLEIIKEEEKKNNTIIYTTNEKNNRR